MNDANSFKNKTEEIQYLGAMLTATTIEDEDRLASIVSRLDEIVFRESMKGFDTIGTVEPIYEHTERSVEIAAFLRGFVVKYKDADLRIKDVFDYLIGLIDKEDVKH